MTNIDKHSSFLRSAVNYVRKKFYTAGPVVFVYCVVYFNEAKLGKIFTKALKIIDIESKYRLLKVCYVPATSTTFLAFFAAATNSTNEINKGGSTCH